MPNCGSQDVTQSSPAPEHTILLPLPTLKFSEEEKGKWGALQRAEGCPESARWSPQPQLDRVGMAQSDPLASLESGT